MLLLTLLSLLLDQSDLDGSGGLDGSLLLLLLLSVLGNWGPLEHCNLLHLLGQLLGGHGSSWELLLLTLLHELLSSLVELSAVLLLHGQLHLLDLSLLASDLGQLLDGQLLFLVLLSLVLLLLLLEGQLNLGDGLLLKLDQWLSDLEGLEDLVGLDRQAGGESDNLSDLAVQLLLQLHLQLGYLLLDFGGLKWSGGWAFGHGALNASLSGLVHLLADLGLGEGQGGGLDGGGGSGSWLLGEQSDLGGLDSLNSLG